MFGALYAMKSSYLKYDLHFLIFMPLLLFQFAQVIPMFASKRIEDLPKSVYENTQIPEGTLSYTTDHGNYHFSKHGTIVQEPMRFFIKLIMFVATIFLYIFTLKKMETNDVKNV